MAAANGAGADPPISYSLFVSTFNAAAAASMAAPEQDDPPDLLLCQACLEDEWRRAACQVGECDRCGGEVTTPCQRCQSKVAMHDGAICHRCAIEDGACEDCGHRIGEGPEEASRILEMVAKSEAAFEAYEKTTPLYDRSMTRMRREGIRRGRLRAETVRALSRAQCLRVGSWHRRWGWGYRLKPIATTTTTTTNDA